MPEQRPLPGIKPSQSFKMKLRIFLKQTIQGTISGMIVSNWSPPHQEDQVDAPYSTTAKALSDLNKLVACERRGEIKSILEKEKSWKTEVSEYVSIPQWLQKASSKMDESADEIDTLLTVLNVLRAHKITTVPRERKNQGSTRLAWTSQGNDQISVSKNNGKRI